MPLLEVRDLHVDFPTRRGTLRALEGVSLTIEAGEILGVIGESGAGKSLTGLAILGLLERPARISSGEILFEGKDLVGLGEREMRRLRGRRIASIFQDPSSTLNPLFTVGEQLIETIRTHLNVDRQEAREHAIGWLEEAGIPAARQRIDSFPHEFSGGMRQRVVIALALCAKPALVIADEPTTALDASVQAQILYLIRRLAKAHGTAIMLITHDMGVIAETADRVAVVYAGRIVERGPVRDVVLNAAHPYTQGLMASIPPLDRKVERLHQIDGAMPRLNQISRGCRFEPRCPHRMERCREDEPALVPSGASFTRCWLADTSAPRPRKLEVLD